MASQRQNQMLEAGAVAPDFRLTGLDGSTHDLREISAGKPVVLAFFKVSCPTCQYTFPFLERMHREGSVPFYAISQDTAKSTREFHREFGITMPTLLDSADEGYLASNAYGIAFVPSLFLVEDGRVTWSTYGFGKRDLEDLGRHVGAAPFRQGEKVPESKSG